MCKFQDWRPLSEEVIWAHLSGRDDRGRVFVAGIYPMLLDEKCYFLAVDFDEGEWAADALAYLETCRRSKVAAVLERSRSGDGGHVWIFFTDAIAAGLARKMASHFLTETMDRRPQAGMQSYDRFFPNQDTLPRGGFGNLIALPLQKAARDRGNSLFINDELQPYADQWEFLSGIEKVSTTLVENIVAAGELRGRVLGVKTAEMDEELAAEPWKQSPSRKVNLLPQGPMPLELTLVLADQLYIPKVPLTPPLRNALMRLAAFQNPEFYKTQAMRMPVHDVPRIISCSEDHAEHLSLPRGCLEEVLALLRSVKIKAILNDERFLGEPVELTFQGELRPDQAKAAEAMLAHDCGVLAATTAFGKTVLAAWLLAQRGVSTLVLVHRQQLMQQWVERLSHFLGLKPKEIGQWGGGKKKLTGKVDVAVIQGLARKGVVNDLVAGYGHVIVDECHHLSAQSFELVLRRVKAKYITGLSATVARKDGHHPIIFMQCGPVRYRVDAKLQAALRPFSHEVIVRPTAFVSQAPPEEDRRLEYKRLCDAVMVCPQRNAQIVADVVLAVQAGRSVVILTERTEHLHLLAAELRSAVTHLICLQGGLAKKVLAAELEKLTSLPVGETWAIVATGKFLGEGFDDSRLDTLFLTMPISWRGTVAQYAGRLHRLHDGKKVVRVYDYADLEVPMLARMFDKRCSGYEAVGYTILLPASALAGWPQDVPLPVDVLWKDNYTASVRRLIRDGVDSLLASLFLHATRPPGEDAEGLARARSASEAFIFRRFETHPDLRGKFSLNTRLNIAFDDHSEMEVDLCCPAAKLVIEIDGGQHLNNAEAYRNDRRRDGLLQMHGWMVLRFLTEDLGKRLDVILDTVLAALAARERETPMETTVSRGGGF